METTITAKTKNQLRRYAEMYETPDFVNGDPSSFMHLLRGTDGSVANKEATAFVAACFSFGSISDYGRDSSTNAPSSCRSTPM